MTAVAFHIVLLRSEGNRHLTPFLRTCISGRPRKATPAYIKRLEETPKDKGYAFTLWTQARLRPYLEQETGIRISRGRFQALLKR